jgi:O-methyltransferase involved in polyketide biosynthesis
MADRHQAELGAVQQTLFIPLAARARETRRKRPVLRDPKAVEMVESIHFDALYGSGWSGFVTILRTVIFDWWVGEFLAAHPAGTVAELGTGLNTRFERADNGTAHWIDLDLPDAIELRRRFFTDTDRRRTIAASLLDEDWMDAVARSPEPYFFALEGVLVYLPEADVMRTLARIARRFPGAKLAFDTYTRRTLRQQHKTAARHGLAAARWAWACDDPRSLEQSGLTLVETAAMTRPPKGLRPHLPPRYRYLLPLADPVLGKALAVNLFRTG